MDCTTKFMIQSIAAHPDFQGTVAWTMNVVTSGTDDIVVENGQTIGAITTQTVTPFTYTNNTVTYWYLKIEDERWYIKN